MIRGILSYCRNSRYVSLVCITSLCTNVFLLVWTQHMRKHIVRYEVDESILSTESLYRNQLAAFLNNTNDRLLDFPDSELSNVSNKREQQYDVTGNDVTGTVQQPVPCTLCPYDPPGLLGPLRGMSQNMGPENLTALFPDMKKGRLQPTQCLSRQKLAIIIPYRNRYPHLHIFLHNIIPFLVRQQTDATFFVIDQALPETFNRGALLNVGFLEAEKIDRFDCYIFHDVDLIPLDDRHLYRCGDNPKHFAVAMNKYKFRMPYKDYFGGAVGFSRHQYVQINGCSNVYFGWGGEDDELKERVFNKGYIITRSPIYISRYEMIKHTRDKGNEVNPVRRKLLSTSKRRQDIEGLNNIRYKINSIKIEDLYIWVNVSLNRTEILHSAPEYVLQAVLPEKSNASSIPKEIVKNELQKTQQRNETAIGKNILRNNKTEIKTINLTYNLDQTEKKTHLPAEYYHTN